MIKQCRRVATRYDKLAANYLAFVKLASIRIWLRANKSTPRSLIGRLGRAQRNPTPSQNVEMGIASLHPSYGSRHPTGKSVVATKSCPAPSAKNISLSPSGKSVLPARPVLSRQEGRFAVVTNAGWDAVDAAALARRFVRRAVFRERATARRRTALQRLRQSLADSTWSAKNSGGGRCVRRSRVVLASVADAKPCGGDVIPTGFDAPSIRLATVTKRNSSPGRARRKPLKPLRGESRVISGGTRGDYRVLTTNAHGLRVLRAPGFPCSLFSMRDDVLSNLGQTMPRECDVIPSRP